MMARENFLAIAALRSSKKLQLYAHNSFKNQTAKTTALRASEQFSPNSSTLLKISSHKALLLFPRLHQSMTQKPEPTTTATAALVTPSKFFHIPTSLPTCQYTYIPEQSPLLPTQRRMNLPSRTTTPSA
jgi:hypothetical protein